MQVFIPYFVLSIILDVITLAAADYSGLMLAIMFVVLLAAWQLGLWVATILILFAISLFVDRKKPQKKVDPFFRKCVNFILSAVIGFCGVRIHASGLDKIPDGRWLFVCNHRSGFDPIVSAWVLKDYGISFITKPEVMKLPLVASFIHKCCYLSIDRENDREALKTILAAIDLIKRDEVSVGVYPEGTRNPSAELLPLLPFRNGAFKIAQKAKVPVVVASIRGSDRVLKNIFRRRTDVYLDIIETVDAEKVAGFNTVEMGEYVQTLMEEDLAKAI